MAGVTLAPASLILSPGAFSGIGTSVPAGKCESVCLSAAMDPGPTDGYIIVQLYPAAITLIFDEPVRYRQPGGSPVLLQNFILSPSTYIVVGSYASGPTMHCWLYNRWQFDA
jgi:hypothetical protein